MSLCLFNNSLVLECFWIGLLNVLKYLVVDGRMVQQVNHTLLLCLLRPLASFDNLLDAEIQIGCCLCGFLPHISQISVSEMPKRRGLFEALFKGLPYLCYIFLVLDSFFKSVPAVVCLISSCHKYEGPLSVPCHLVCHEDNLHPSFELSPSGHFVSCSPFHVRILLSGYCSRHLDLKDGPLRNQREIDERYLRDY